MNKREQMKQQRREHIVQVAKQLFLQHTIPAVQLQDVAREAGIGIATLYRYFANKDLLVLAVNEHITLQMGEAIAEIAARPVTAYEQIEQILDHYIALIYDPHYQFARFFKAVTAYKPSVEGSEQYEQYMHSRRLLANILITIANKGYADKSIRTDIDLYVYIFTIVQNISHFTVESALTEHDPTLPFSLKPEQQLTLIKQSFLQFLKPNV